MRRLLPLPATEVFDLDAAYWVDDPGPSHVRAVMVTSVDGAAQANGRSAGLSGPADSHLFGLLRGHADVIVVGATTARAERYGGVELSADRTDWRRAHGLSDVPPIAVVTRSGSLDLDGPLFGTATSTGPATLRPIVVTQAGLPARRRAELAERAEVIVAGEGDVDIPGALDALAERGLRRVSCEGGPHLLTSVVAARRLDELCLTISPLLLAGAATRMLDGSLLAPPTGLELVHVLEESGTLFLRMLLRN